MPRILLVEDNELNRDMLSRRLKRRGFEVLIAVDGGEGVSMATSELPDLILMDMSLPVMNGWQATRTLKTGAQTASIPIIALTAHAMVGDREEALAAGCDDYDTKPVDFKRLLQKIEQQLQAAQARPTESVTAVVPESEHPVVSPVAVSSDQWVAASSGLGNSEQRVASTATAIHSEQLTTPSDQNFPAILHPQQHPLDAGLKLLVVDDNEANRDMLSRRLERKGYEIIIAESGESALQLLATTDIALVLLDIMMPGIGGIETLKQIRQTHSQAQLPVIMATAKDASEDVVEALELGANDYITKPIDLPVALARIQTHLKTREAAEVSHPALAQSTVQAQPVSFWSERYRLVEVLSKHPLGQTAIAQDLQDPEGALRMIHTFRLDTNNPEVLQAAQDMFLAEMAILKQIKPNELCIPLISYLQDGEVFYMIHEYVEGTVLSKSLETTAALAAKDTCKLADDLLTILDFLHQSRIIHAYPHPGCFMHPSGNKRKLVLIDYGITTRLLSKLSQQYPHYQKVLQSHGEALAPELLAGNFSAETDLYTVGKTLLGALQNQVHLSDSPLVDVHNETAHIFQTMCQPRPEERYPSIYAASRAVRNHWHKLWKVELSSKSE